MNSCLKKIELRWPWLKVAMAQRCSGLSRPGLNAHPLFPLEIGAFSRSESFCFLLPANMLVVTMYRYRKAVNAYSSHQSASFKAAFHGDASLLQVELARIENERLEILQLLSPDHHAKLVEKGLKRLSFNATIAALMIHMYVALASASNPQHYVTPMGQQHVPANDVCPL